MDEFTRKFNTSEDREVQTRYILSAVYDALKEKGYDPINQIVGYILSEDPTYITNHNGARTLICKLDRDEMLQALVRIIWICNRYEPGCANPRPGFPYGYLTDDSPCVMISNMLWEKELLNYG